MEPQVCTRQKRHDGPCNGFPCEWVRYRLIVDEAWRTATESETVPSTFWADEIILKAFRNIGN